MAIPQQQKISLLLLSIIFFFPFSSACGITVYWGQNVNEETLQAACATNYYKYVTVAFLTTFGDGRTPVINLSGHCDQLNDTCTALASQIRYCQELGIKVLLSLGGSSGNYSISTADNAAQVAAFLWSTYLSSAASGPLGDAALDGVDFDIEITDKHWDDLARAIAGYSTPERKIYLSAAPQCIHPDAYLDDAIKTGLFDYVWVQFYNNPSCDYTGGAKGLIDSWNTWSSSLPSGNQLFLGLPAALEAASSGYIPPESLVKDILPSIRNSANYGGVMLWSRYYDLINSYSPRIIAAVCPAAAATSTTTVRKFEELLISQVL